MNWVLWLRIALLLPVVAGCGGGSSVTPSTAATVGAAVRSAVGSAGEAWYFDSAVDLNGDGRNETVVYAAGPAVCGTGGCPVYVFAPDPDGLRLVSSISVSRPPVRRSPRGSHGWSDLIVGVGGGGLPAGNAELAFDGRTYPSNATMPPAYPVENLDGTEVLIPEFGSYTDGTIVPPAILGDAAAPVAGSVLGAEIHVPNVDGLRFYVLRRLMDRYAADNGIVVSQSEIDAYLRRFHEAMTNDPTMPVAGQESAEDRAAQEESAQSFIWQWKVNKAVYDQYGGRIAFQQGGPEPLDAYRQLLEESQARGEFTIASPELEKEFWSYYRNDSIHSFFPQGSPEEKNVFTVPPWTA